ncbi:MAG TPA: MarR family winged helix-turn-helix transcriptional regulator [Streptosporangiaceae bacterium]|nr:MarR family winged helix-turn-helix transcriptional regulator [Streptosporangiaceae bacterium]
MPPSSRPTADANPDLRLLFSELVRLETELWDAVEGRLRADFGVTLPVFEFMQVISRTPDCRVQDIAAELSITVGGTSKIVDRIEASAYCARSANPSDRRSSVIKLTPTGKRLLPRLTAAVDDELRKRLGTRVPDRSLVQLTKTLTKLRAGVRAQGAVGKTA